MIWGRNKCILQIGGKVIIVNQRAESDRLPTIPLSFFTFSLPALGSELSTPPIHQLWIWSYDLLQTVKTSRCDRCRHAECAHCAWLTRLPLPFTLRRTCSDRYSSRTMSRQVDATGIKCKAFRKAQLSFKPSPAEPWPTH